MDRTAFLHSIWNPYPAMPSSFMAAGRIVSLKRQQGELVLGLVRDQQQCELLFPEAPAFSEFLECGDLVAVVSTTEIVLLAPCLISAPTRKYKKNVLGAWSDFLEDIRLFFKRQDFLELKTPGLVPCPGTEPSLDVFATELKVGSRRQRLYLPTSPELHLKKALSYGADKIFELAPVFRNGEITERHQPEFTMLEWYRAYDNLAAIKKDVESLIFEMTRKFQVAAPASVKSYSVAELFQIYCDFELKPETSLEELRSLAHRLGVDVHSAESIDDYFFLIFMEKIENHLPSEDLIFVEKYPPYQAALARLTPDGWGDRFEVYWKGLELGNAFHELNDPTIQRLRSQEDLVKKRDLNKDIVLLDEEFFQALEAGMPPSGGIAVGVERLFMALFDIKHIKDLRLFPY